MDALASREPDWKGFLVVDGPAGACSVFALMSGAAAREELGTLLEF
jgi:hypothetical protein